MPDAPDGSLSSSWFRNVPGRLAAGVCVAIANHFRWNVVLVRVAFVATLAISGGLACWVYLAFWALTPFDAGSKSPAQRLLGGVSSFFTTSVATSAPPDTVAHQSDSNVASVE